MNSSPWDYLLNLGIQFYSLSNDKLITGNKVCNPTFKLPCIVEALDSQRDDVKCDAVGCNTIFSSISELEVHQHARHSHVCASCHAIMPSHHLLDRHILEVHDSLFHILAQKKSMYLCLLEFCDKVFQTPLERKKHCIEDHKFPSDFRYDLQWRKLKSAKVVNNGNAKKQNHAKCGQNNVDVSNHSVIIASRCKDNSDEMECSSIDDKHEQPQMSLSHSDKKVSVPNLISFGIGIPRAFPTNKGRKGKHWHQRNQIQNTQSQVQDISLKEMNRVLEDMES